MLTDQQDQLNGAMAEIARLKKGQEKASRPAVLVEENSQAAGIKQPEAGKTSSTALQGEKTRQQAQSVSSEGCQMAVLGQDGKVVKLLPIEYAEKKENTSMLSGLFSRLFFRRRLDIVKLLAGKNLEKRTAGAGKKCNRKRTDGKPDAYFSKQQASSRADGRNH